MGNVLANLEKTMVDDETALYTKNGTGSPEAMYMQFEPKYQLVLRRMVNFCSEASWSEATKDRFATMGCLISLNVTLISFQMRRKNKDDVLKPLGWGLGQER